MKKVDPFFFSKIQLNTKKKKSEKQITKNEKGERKRKRTKIA